MNRLSLTFIFSIGLCGLMAGCASSDDRNNGRGYGNRQPAYSRSGRPYREPRPMNHRRVDTDAIFNACTRERSEMYCRNRMGR